MKILLLGGTLDARKIAMALSRRDDIAVTMSLAGVTSSPLEMGVPLRIGGFGGAEGLAAYLVEANIDLLIDATHPYASGISANAARACRETAVRRMALWRPGWHPAEGDNWQLFPTWGALASSIPDQATVFLAAGQDGMTALRGMTRFAVFARALVRPDDMDPHVHLIKSLPGKTPDDEIELLTRYGITHIACKNSGGTASAAKLVAARRLGVPVLMVDRPPPPPAPLFDSADAILAVI
ncbi:MAG: precorrin-6A/cobalt-precorrin-6A reductase [Alphaproteobacteria bacterium]|nr:precorrin-6A/cobalt-precorrin-6A reductase [Alphaproteobacteria bacterium]